MFMERHFEKSDTPKFEGFKFLPCFAEVLRDYDLTGTIDGLDCTAQKG